MIMSWTRKHNLALRASIAGGFGFLFMCIAQGWFYVPQISHPCTDSIVAVQAVKYGSCDPGQSLSYMRDLDGARYIICRCHGNSIITDSQESPEVPEILLREFDPDPGIVAPDSTAHVKEEDPTEQVL